jgi:hypothetical protein
MSWRLSILFLVATVSCVFGSTDVDQFRLSIPKHSVTGSQPPPYPEWVAPGVMQRIAREAPRIAEGIYAPDIVRQMRFSCVNSPQKGAAFDIVIEGPKTAHAEIESGLGKLNIQFLIRYVTLYFTYDTSRADIRRDEVAPLQGLGSNRPNQLPDPTSPPVTPPAGAGGAPSVAADH